MAGGRRLAGLVVGQNRKGRLMSPALSREKLLVDFDFLYFSTFKYQNLNPMPSCRRKGAWAEVGCPNNGERMLPL